MPDLFFPNANTDVPEPPAGPVLRGVLRILLLLVLVVTAAALILLGLDARARKQAVAQLDEAVLTRRLAASAETGGPETDEGRRRWLGELSAGAQRESDLWIRVFTGTAYLRTDTNDRAFAADAYRVLEGRDPDPAWLDRADVFFSNGGSRLSFLRQVPEIGEVRNPEGTVRSFDIRSRFPRIGMVTVGIAVAEFTCDIDGLEAAVSLYVDGQLRRQTLLEQDTSEKNALRVEWDTRDEDAGPHDITVLLRSSDGRGRVVERGRFTVPMTERVPDGTARSAQLVGHEQWFRLDPETDAVRFNTHAAEGNVALELYSVYGDPLVSCDLRDTPHQTLRYLAEETGTFFARVRRGAAQPSRTQVTYDITTSDRSLLDPDSGRLLAVLEDPGDADRIAAAGEDGAVRMFSARQVRPVTYTARLGSLTLLMPDRSPADLYPVFDPETGEYGLYLQEEAGLDGEGPLSFRLEALEGTAATLRVTAVREDGQTETLDPEGFWMPARSENRFRATVTGHDGSQRSYTLYVLYGPHTGGYDTETLLAFPPGYQSGLWLLKQQRPAYVVMPYDTGIGWEEFIAAQTEQPRSLIQADSVPDSWVAPDSPVYDGPSWKAASRPVVEHYADPRHFLLQGEVFQFEHLTFSETTHTRAGIRAILEGTFMASDMDRFADAFYAAGEEAGISPYFLASRAIQEMGSTTVSPLGTGTLEGYEGYYNFFNVGSYPNPEVEDGQRINGALFAMYGNDPEEKEITEEEERLLLPWDTAEKSIRGGALFIAERYVAAGQDTLYFQKFDVIPENGLYARQYAQNIQMAWAEGLRYYRAYDDIGLLDAPFVFRIPFYAGMPTQPVSLP